MRYYIVKQIAPEIFIVSWDWNVPKFICNIVFLSQISMSLKGQDSFDFTIIWRENNISGGKKKKNKLILSISSKEKKWSLYYFILIAILNMWLSNLFYQMAVDVCAALLFVFFLLPMHVANVYNNKI